MKLMYTILNGSDFTSKEPTFSDNVNSNELAFGIEKVAERLFWANTISPVATWSKREIID